MSIPKRHEINVNETWDLTHLFKDDKTFYKQLEIAVNDVNDFSNKYTNKLDNADIAVKILKEFEKLQERLVQLGTYARLYSSQDESNVESMKRAGTLNIALSNTLPKLNFISQELKQLDKKVLNEIKVKDKSFEVFIDDVIRELPHTLDQKVEDAISVLNPTLNAPQGIYNMHKLVDMKFDNVVLEDKEIPMTFGFFEDELAFDLDKEVRHKSFDGFYKRLKDSENTVASIYNAHIQKEKALAKLKGFDNTIDYLLFDQKVSRDMYDRQIDLIMKHLAKPMQKYAKLLQEIHGLDKMTFKDLHLVVDPEFEPEITIPDAKEKLVEGLSVLGKDYTDMIEKAFDERWIDFPFNEGKSTGAFCSSPYGANPYILISWTKKMRELFVLAHELGHAGHFYLAGQHQNILNTRASLYFIEAPSTMNELLVANHLLKDADDKRFRRWVLSTLVSRTYYHNFVTHLHEAAYQREVYKMIDNNQPINAHVLNETFKKVLLDFWGDAVEISDNVELTWMRQPHYYMGLYPYTYSAGLTVATVASQKVVNNELDIDKWKDILKAGGTKTPLELAKIADIDLSSEEPLLNTIQHIEAMIDEIIKLTEELNNQN